MGRVISALMVCFLLSGCVALNWPKEDQQKATTNKDLDLPEKEESNGELSSDAISSQEMLALYESLYQAPKKEIKKHKELAKAQYNELKTVDKGLEYSLILLISGSASDLKTARAIIKQVSKKHKLKQGDGYIGLMNLLDLVLIQKSQFQDKIDSLESVLEKREQELVTLREQLNALKNIDQNIHEREVGTAHDSR